VMCIKMSKDLKIDYNINIISPTQMGRNMFKTSASALAGCPRRTENRISTSAAHANIVLSALRQNNALTCNVVIGTTRDLTHLRFYLRTGSCRGSL
jgi:hypothetical protein